MTVGDLKNIIHNLPDDSTIEIFNSSYEWYGVLSVESDQIVIKNGKVVINFGGAWDEYDNSKYDEEETSTVSIR